ncbi:UNVERIFIED_CONTAM: hypothetical protein Sindi_0931700 [Sesamum indicum]
MQNVTLPADANVSERGKETINITHTFGIRSDMDGHNQEGQEVQQKVIFTDSKASNKHKRNKSIEGNTILAKSPKTGATHKTQNKVRLLLLSTILMIKLIIWNVRGIGKLEKQKILSDFLLENKPDMLILLEPFVQLDAVYFTRKFAFHSVFSNSNNKIWCFAKLGVDIQIIQDHTQFLHVKVNSGALPEDIFCTFIYAKCYRTPRRILWDELTRISHQTVPWLIGGDFNAILLPNENQGGDMRRIGSMDDFNDMMFDTGLIDAGFEGEPFTWTNNRVWRRLDRVLYSKEWTESFNTTRVLHLPRRLSDHHPLLINAANVEDKKPSSFRFQNMWLKHHTFLDTIKQSWCLPTEGYGMYKLQQKIYRIKVLLKLWNKDTFGNVFTTVEQAKQNATEAEKRFDMDPSEANLIDLKRSNAALVHALILESEYWKQKSNCKWLEAGERNTKYFHSLVKKKRVKSTIHRIMEENQEVTIPDRIRESATAYFKNLLSCNPARNNAPEFPFQFPQVSEECTRIIGRLPTDEEIRDIVFSIDKDSIEGPDGFSSASIKPAGISLL